VKILIMFLVAASAMNSYATELKPFLGVGGQFQFMMKYSAYVGSDPRDYSDIYPSLEPHIEVGCKIGKWEVYGTYEFVEPRGDEWSFGSPVDTVTLTSESGFRSEYWTNERYCLGVRYRGYDDPVRPLLGIGLEVGQFVQSHRDARHLHYYEIEEVEWDSVTYQYYNRVYSRLLYDERDRWKSALNVGGVVEIGVGISLIDDIEVIGVTRIHGAYANFGTREYNTNIGDYSITSPAFLIQLRYSPFTFKL